MARGILYVESRPASPEQEAEYHAWHETHIREILGFEGFVTARRFSPVGDDGGFVTIYEIEADDIAAARARLSDASQRGETTPPSGLQLDPPPTVRLLEQIGEYEQ